jgi:hypothetical protein
MFNYGWRAGSAGVSPAKDQMKGATAGFNGEFSAKLIAGEASNTHNF